MVSAQPHVVRRRRLTLILLATLLVAALFSLTSLLSACSQTPTSVPVRTFERAQRMDVACLRLYDPPAPGEALNEFHPREPVGRPQAECAPVPSNLDGEAFDKQLFAFVTQSTRGELAVVDLSAGKLVDQSRATPGINFIPVGALPTDVAVTPDGKMVFVASAETNKPAIYGIPTRRILGDTPGFPRDPSPITLGSWPVCALPQNPGAITVVPRRKTTAAADGGTDAGAPSKGMPLEYDLVIVLPGDRQNTAKILTLDPRPFRRGGIAHNADGTLNYASDVSDGDTPVVEPPGSVPVLEPGTLRPCAELQVSAVELVGAPSVPTSFVPGPLWEDGVKYVDGGVDLTCKRPTPALGCGLPPCCAAVPIPIADGGTEGGTPDSGSADGGAPSDDGGACEPVVAKDAGPIPLNVGPIDPPRLVSLARDEQLLYIADQGAPLIHVLDMSTPSAPRELPPLLATSLADPARAVLVKDLALSPPTRDYKRYLYAIDRSEGSVMVYDVTDPLSAQRTPLLRPHPELNPFQPADRIAFSSPVVAMTFARHDVPLAQLDGVRVASAASGLLCNPNRRLQRVQTDPTVVNIPPGDPRSDLGYYYRADISDPGQSIGPRRLRGIFGFVTLASGSVIPINVDDWDSPCRRPQDMSKDVSDIALAQTDRNDTDPYHAPVVDSLAVTNEAFFPMSAPHSLRSEVLITNDTVSGNNLPRIVSPPSVSSNGVVLPLLGPGSEDTPVLDVAFSFDEPQVHVDQDWAIVYEPPIPGFEGLAATVDTSDDYQSLSITQPQARFCSKGVEDWARGIDRTKQINADLAKRGKSLPAGAERWMTDYVQLTEDLLAPSDDYWNLGPDQQNSCWEGRLAEKGTAGLRYDACARTYGAVASEEKPTRDFPIIEAYDDHVVLGRFYTSSPTAHREVVFRDKTNKSDLKFMQCCFHHQVRFRVRTGQLWGAIGQSPGGGSGLGFFSHLTTDSAGRCVASCDPRESLLNGRIATIPAGIDGTTISKDSPIAMRNPMYTAVMHGATSGKEPVRDTFYSFSSRGGFRTLSVVIGGASISVSPQSMRYIESLGQVAVVDGASQGLVLIDLTAVTVARAPYF